MTKALYQLQLLPDRATTAIRLEAVGGVERRESAPPAVLTPLESMLKEQIWSSGVSSSTLDTGHIESSASCGREFREDEEAEAAA